MQIWGFDSCDWRSSLYQIGPKSSIIRLVWPSNLTDDLAGKTEHHFHVSRNHVCHLIAIHGIQLELSLKKYHNRSQIVNFSARVTLKYDRWQRSNSTSSMPLQFLCIILYPFLNQNWSYSSETLKSLKFDGWSWTPPPKKKKKMGNIYFDLWDIVLSKGRQPLTNLLLSTNRQPVASRTPFSRSVDNQMPTD